MTRGELREYRRRLALRDGRRHEVERAAGWHAATVDRSRCRVDDDEHDVGFAEFKMAKRWAS